MQNAEYVALLKSKLGAGEMTDRQILEGADELKRRGENLESVQGKTPHEVLLLAQAIREMVIEHNAAQINLPANDFLGEMLNSRFEPTGATRTLTQVRFRDSADWHSADTGHAAILHIFADAVPVEYRTIAQRELRQIFQDGHTVLGWETLEEGADTRTQEQKAQAYHAERANESGPVPDFATQKETLTWINEQLQARHGL